MRPAAPRPGRNAPAAPGRAFTRRDGPEPAAGPPARTQPAAFPGGRVSPRPAATPAAPAAACGLQQPVRSPGHGRKPIGSGGPGPRAVDEDLLVRRYVKARWTIAACARSAGITRRRARDILLAQGIAIREIQPPDQDTVIAVYQRQKSMQAVAVVLGTSDQKVKEILAARGIQVAPRQRPRLATRRPAPARAGHVTLAEATRLLGWPGRLVKQAAADGRVATERDEHGRLWYNRGDVEALAGRPRAEAAPPDQARREPAEPPGARQAVRPRRPGLSAGGKRSSRSPAAP